MGAFETMLKGMREAKEQQDKGDFEWEGGSEFLATLRCMYMSWVDMYMH